MDKKGKPKAAEVTADAFMARHERELEESEKLRIARRLVEAHPQGPKSMAWFLNSNPGRDIWIQEIHATREFQLIRELREFWHVRLLRAAQEENSPEAFRELLEELLMRLRIKIPEGVFRKPRGSPGAPRKKWTKQIFEVWIENGQPAWSKLAHIMYAVDYTRADATQRKILRDRCRVAVRRYQAMSRDENAAN